MARHTYRQKFQQSFLPGISVSALYADGSCVWIGTDQGFYRIEAGAPELLRPELVVTCLASAGDDGLWVGTRTGLYRFVDAEWTQLHAHPVLALAADSGGRVWTTDGGMISGEGESPPVEAAIRDLLVAEDELWLATDRGLYGQGRFWTTEDGLLDDDARTLLFDRSGHLWIATAAGISLFDRKGCWYSLTGKNGLPYEDVTRLTARPDGERWVGTSIGAARYANGRWEYYAGKRWLPSDTVTAFAIEPEGTAWIGTDLGLARIERRPYDFEEKAAAFEERITARHNRYGFVTDSHFQTLGDPESFMHEASDNDGLWTALYIAAESFRFAVTGSLEARELARRSMQALLMLEQLTTIDGFPARAVTCKGEERVIQSHGEWHESADGEWLWKADTSSDEVDGHMFAYSIYHDLVADEEEKRRIAGTVSRIMGYIVDNDFLLIDLDGQPTRWGVWNPSYLNGPWKAQQGLNSLEILSYLKVAYQLTGESRFDEAYRYLIEEHHYALNTIDQKITPPGIVNHSDDELAFLAYYALLTYETDPDLRAIYLLGLERQWQYERPEHCPLWNFIYGALTGNTCDREQAVEALERIPMDLITWTVRNSHRTDIQTNPDQDRFEAPQSLVALPADERPMMRWNGNPYRLDGGSDGRSEDDGTFYLIAYWLGRYYGLVDALG